MTVTINGTTGVTYPAGGTDNTAGAGVGTTDTQTLSNKSITAANSNTVEATSGPTSTQLAGQRNKIVNGAMQVWQRGTTFTANGYGPDRFYLNLAGTCTFTQETSDVPTGAQYSLKWATGASSSYGQVRQFLEQLNVIPLRGLTVTASAMVKISSGFSGTLAWECGYSSTGDTIASAFSLISTTQTGTPTSSGYTKITATFTVPSNAVGLYVGIVPTVAQASGQYALQSLIQFEPGATATPFENRLYGAELALCQRYFEKIGDGASRLNLGAVAGVSSTRSYGTRTYQVTKRATPTITVNNPTAFRTIGVNNGGGCTVSVADADNSSFGFDATATGYAAGAANIVQSQDGSYPTIFLSSEL